MAHLTEGEKRPVLPGDPLLRALDAMTRHGLDGDAMLLYMSSINLMQILELAGRRLTGSAGASMSTGPVSYGTAPAPLEAALGAITKLLGGAGVNPGAAASLLAALCQNADLAGLTGLLSPNAAGQAPINPSSEKTAQDSHVESSSRREPPKIMKWEQLDDKKKGGAG